MSLALEIAALMGLVALSALYSGSEIGFYRLSTVQVDIDARGGSRRAQLMRWLLRDESALLVTILIGNNLALEIATHVGESIFGQALGIHDEGTLALAVTLALTPLVFLFGEALPKDLVHQRPHALTGMAAPWIALSRVVFWPLERVLRIITVVLERMLGLGSDVVAPVAGKEAVLGFLAEGRRHGVLSERAESLASNVLRLRTLPVSEAMTPWAEVEVLRQGDGPEEQFEVIRTSHFSRIPAVDPSVTGPDSVLGYVHQLEVLHRWWSDGAAEIPDSMSRIQSLQRFDHTVSVDRALQELRASGRRVAIVVDGEELLGLISVNDLLDRISGEVVG